MQISAKTQEKTGFLHVDQRIENCPYHAAADVHSHPVLAQVEPSCDGNISADGVAIEYGAEQLQRPS